MKDRKEVQKERRELKKEILVECIKGSIVRRLIEQVEQKQPIKNKEIEDYFIEKEGRSRSTIYRVIEKCCEAGILEKRYNGKNKYLEVKKQTRKTLEKVVRFLEIEKKYFPEKVIEMESKNDFLLDKALNEEI